MGSISLSCRTLLADEDHWLEDQEWRGLELLMIEVDPVLVGQLREMSLMLHLDQSNTLKLLFPTEKSYIVFSAMRTCYLGDHANAISNVHHDVPSCIHIVLDPSQHVDPKHGGEGQPCQSKAHPQFQTHV